MNSIIDTIQIQKEMQQKQCIRGVCENLLEVGKIDLNLLDNEFENIVSDKVIITDERRKHILDNHKDDYEIFNMYVKKIISELDLIIKDCKNENTIFMIKRLIGTNLNAIIKLSIESNRLNSIMTFYRMRDKNLIKLKKNKIIYKKE